jgi:hypothetical protein
MAEILVDIPIFCLDMLQISKMSTNVRKMSTNTPNDVHEMSFREGLEDRI